MITLKKNNVRGWESKKNHHLVKDERPKTRQIYLHSD